MLTSILEEAKSKVKSKEGDDEDEGEGEDEEGEGEGRRLMCHWKCSDNFFCKYIYNISLVGWK